jgi:outer membrane protein OmpA-like peptidoglycan-associated protein
MASILENIQTLLTPEILSRVAGRIGEPESAVMKGFSAAIPAIVGTIAQRSDDRGFMRDLADLATSTAADPNAIASAAETAFSPTGEGSMSATDNWLSSVFGRNLPGLADSIARFAGIRGSAAASLLSSAAPLVLTYLGRWIRRDNLSAARLGEQLRNQRFQIATAMPAGFDLPPGLRAPFEATTAYVAPARDTSSLNVPTMILLGVLGLGGLLWWGVRAYKDHAQATIERGFSTLVGTTGTVNDMVTRTLPGNVNLSFPRGGIEDALSSYLASPIKGSAAFEFNRIGFETGSATLTPLSREQLQNVAAILNAYPKASVTIEGFTDNIGEESGNVSLSRARAESVAGALVADGVTPTRVRSEGFGSQKPIASNATEFGRAQNRRVMLEVISR